MKIKNRQSSNIEDVTQEDPWISEQKLNQSIKGRTNDVLKEPTPIREQGNNEGRKFNYRANLTVKNNLNNMFSGGRVGTDPSPSSFTKSSGLKDGFLKHTIVDNLKK